MQLALITQTSYKRCVANGVAPQLLVELKVGDCLWKFEKIFLYVDSGKPWQPSCK